MIEQPKKERRFLKTLGRVGEIILEKVLIRLGSNLIKKIGGKKSLPSILFLFLSISLFAQYPNTGNKQRLGFQTTGDGLMWRGSISDTAAIQPINNQNAWVILDTVNLKIYSFDFTSNVWSVLPQGTTLDTTSLNNRINLKVNISDTASMLTPYFRGADTTSLNLTSRFAAKLNLSDTASMLTNYLRTSVAASTYLPLTGGTLTGALNGTTGTFNTKLIAGNIGSSSGSPIFTAGLSGTETEFHILQGTGYEGSPTTLRLTNNNGSYYQNGLFLKSIMERGLDEYNGRIGIMGTDYMILNKNNRIGIFNTTPSTTFDVNGTFKASGNSLIGGTLGVTGEATLLNKTFVGNFLTDNTPTSGGNHNIRLESNDVSSIGFHDSGNTIANIRFSAATGFVIGGSDGTYGPHSTTIAGATTLSAPLTVNSSAVFNEGSTDSDFRVESDGNANMLFVDASTDRVGIGYASPTKTLDVNGEVRINTVTATPTALLGKDGSNVVGEVTTVAQTGLMTRGETTATTGSPSAIFTVTHGLGSTPTSVLVTSAGIAGAEKIIFEVYSKNSTTFSVQAWNYDGTEASNKSVKIFWLAIK